MDNDNMKGYALIDGVVYISDNPKLKTIHKEGECVIGGFRKVAEFKDIPEISDSSLYNTFMKDSWN